MEDDACLPAQAAWEAIRASLRRSCGERIFDGWLKPLALASCDLDAGDVRLTAPSAFMANWVQGHFAEQIAAAWRAMLPQVVHVSIEAATDAMRVTMPEPAAEPVAPSVAPAAETATLAHSTTLEQRYTFDSFVVGKANELAYNAARTLAEGGKLAFNPLFLHGGVGLGKTHLMHAIGHEYRARHPEARILYMSAEKFMFEFVAAMRAKDTHSFKQRLRAADVLMIDDVQFIAGKESTQEEFFHTMNELISAGRRLVISADRSPQTLEGIESRILSRLSWGLVADVNPADFELRYNIICKKLENQPAGTVPQDVALFLAKRISASVRELEGALNRVMAFATLNNRVIDLDFAQEALADQLRASQRRVSIDEIQRRVCEHYRIRQAEMGSARRAREVARPRQIAMYLAKQLTQRSLPEIGRRFGGRDHTTVIHAVRKIEELRIKDAELDADVRLLLRQLEA
ncbi:chromosomal replication initiator protein DnaA [Sphingomonas nostoxanthinifaciens]|uniref:chromosomal replication initiator protein DnaA n=1 Tax=Sphingomonas nostoxanthinifaciens TaxID=2872652 RepID=UPI001CC1E68C|nr:chromosomal replication initiator protein DnaA [Sphingomonas nostoxanthinifaciens]UAK22821.1 chromosomal replication initiator protein DnaA [Sphingomonas nostoxanthinifaciens]